MRKTLLGAAALLGATFFTGSASAQSVFEGFAVQKFEPSERGSDWFGNESLDLRGKIRPAVGLVADYSYRSLLIFEDDGDVRGSIVRNQVMLHPSASLVLFDRLRLAVNVPIQAAVDGNSAGVRREALDGPGVIATRFAAPQNAGAIGDVRVGADVRLLGKYGEAFTLAGGVQLWIPTGSTSQYVSDGYARIKPRMMVAGDIGMFTYAGSVGVNIRTRGTERLGPAGIGQELNLTAALGAKVLDKALTVGPEMWMSSVFTGDHFLQKKYTPLEVGVGAHYLIANQIRVGGAVMSGPVRAWSNPVYRFIAMAEWAPGIDEDRDGDGIPDSQDACPDQKGPRSAEPSRNGCPEVAPPPTAPADRDNDGIVDTQDACPDVPGTRTSDPSTNGCRDTDGDGIFDPKDACPTEKGLPNQDPTLNGCPDSDGDGIVDKLDACPTEAGPKSEDPKKNGCPIGDKDKDGVKDDVDACPDEPGAPDPDPKRNGCPKAFISGGQIRILDQVKFKTGSAQIEPGKDSEEVLDAVQKVLAAHADIKKLRIEGHTDNKGNAAMNKKLSADRAAQVKEWLVKHGIKADRLTTAGFGLEKPKDTNETEEGRRNNRRVEFHIE